MNNIQEKHKFEYSKINDSVYLGTNLCCLTHFKDSLIRKGIEADISLEKERLDKPFGVKYYLWLPTKDKDAPSFKQLLLGVKSLDFLIKNKIKIYVHCKNGHGRSPTLVIAYLISKGKSIEEAIRIIKKKRPAIHLTKKQTNGLKEFARRIKQNRKVF